MEATSIREIYHRSIKLHNIRYRPFIGDGDCASFSMIEKEMPYGPLVDIKKSECVNHITKRMGTGLRQLLQDYKGTALSL